MLPQIKPQFLIYHTSLIFHKNASNFEIKVSLELFSTQLRRNFTVREACPTPTTHQRLNLFHFIAEPITSTQHHQKQLLKVCTLVWIKSTSNSGQASEAETHRTSLDPEQDPWFLPIVPCHLGSSWDLRQYPVAVMATSNTGWPTTAMLFEWLPMKSPLQNHSGHLSQNEQSCPINLTVNRQ